MELPDLPVERLQMNVGFGPRILNHMQKRLVAWPTKQRSELKRQNGITTRDHNIFHLPLTAEEGDCYLSET
jgi:hypothetical protein